MYLFIVSIVLLVPFLGLFIYKSQGKKQIFHLDVVQFTYLFIFMPVMFIWAKAFLFYLLNNEVGSALSNRDAFIIDTTFSVVAFYLFSAVSIHSLTKTFRLRKQNDPDFDVFHLSEYFHLWWSHIFMYVGGLIAVSFLSTLNVFIPIEIVENKTHLFIAILLSVLVGMQVFFMIWSSDPKQEKRRFLRLMKLCLMATFIYHVMLYFLLDPRFSVRYVFFWFVLCASLSASVSGFSFVRSNKAQRLRLRMVHEGWGKNIQLFEKKKL